jgi:hypothetical protein
MTVQEHLTVGELIDDINTLMGVHCLQLKDEPHKCRDGVWCIEFNSFVNRVSVFHHGYHFEFSADRHTRNLGSALQSFLDAINQNVKTFKRGAVDEDD